MVVAGAISEQRQSRPALRVDKAGRHYFSVRVDDERRSPRAQIANGPDAISRDAYVNGPYARQLAGPVVDSATPDDYVEVRLRGTSNGARNKTDGDPGDRGATRRARLDDVPFAHRGSNRTTSNPERSSRRTTENLHRFSASVSMDGILATMASAGEPARTSGASVGT